MGVTLDFELKCKPGQRQVLQIELCKISILPLFTLDNLLLFFFVISFFPLKPAK